MTKHQKNLTSINNKKGNLAFEFPGIPGNSRELNDEIILIPESGIRNQEFRNDKESLPGINITIICVVLNYIFRSKETSKISKYELALVIGKSKHQSSRD